MHIGGIFDVETRLIASLQRGKQLSNKFLQPKNHLGEVS
jgi:hypothetical protein